jgi:cytochrome bd ubiquinol oxidase subunit I
MGVTMMGGFMSWLWIVQAFLIGILFLAGNYYLWLGLGRIPGGERFAPYTKYMLAVLVVGFIVWATPHSMIATGRSSPRWAARTTPSSGCWGS